MATRQPTFTTPTATAPLLDGYARHYGALLRFLKRRTGCHEDAQELAHDTWLRLAQEPQRAATSTPIAAPADPRAYLFTVAANLAVDRHRRDMRADHALLLPEQAALMAPDVADVHAHRQALDAVMQGLGTVPDRARSCFLAHRLDGIGHDELAQRHGVSIKTIERDVKLAMDSVQAAIEHWHGHRGLGSLVPHTSRRRALSALLSVTGLVGGAALTAAVWRAHTSELQLASAVGKRLTQALPDGSELTLDANSHATWRATALERELRLEQGSAFLAVASESGLGARLFSLHALGVLVTTANAHLGIEIDGDTVGIEVARHRAMLRIPNGQTLSLESGDAARVSPQGRISVQRQPPGRAGAWRNGWLDFFHMPLGQAIARLERYSAQPLVVAPEVAGLTVLGRVQVDDVASWLQLLPRHLPVRLSTRADGVLRIGPR